MNKFLKTRVEIENCTSAIKKAGLINHGLSCKDYDIWNIISKLQDGNILDMGSSGSYILENAVQKGIKGRKVGIDLAYQGNKTTDDGIEQVKGDLMNTPFYDGTFATVCVLSVVEHEVDYSKLAAECARLLMPKGTVYLTCDYWPEKISTEGLELYGLKWNILDKNDVLQFIAAFEKEGLYITSDVDWTVTDKVINDRYCAPFPNIAYTFGLFEFIKQ